MVALAKAPVVSAVAVAALVVAAAHWKPKVKSIYEAVAVVWVEAPLALAAAVAVAAVSAVGTEAEWKRSNLNRGGGLAAMVEYYSGAAEGGATAAPSTSKLPASTSI